MEAEKKCFKVFTHKLFALVHTNPVNPFGLHGTGGATVSTYGDNHDSSWPSQHRAAGRVSHHHPGKYEQVDNFAACFDVVLSSSLYVIPFLEIFS